MRLAILPLAIIQMRSMRGMQKIAPELQKLKEKHKGDNQKLQAEMMALYREHGVNPVGSCLPLLFQLPVFMGLFFVLRGFSDDPPDGRPELPRRLHRRTSRCTSTTPAGPAGC